MHHIPSQLVFAHQNFATDEPAGAVLHRSKSLGQNLVEGGALVGGSRDAGTKLFGLGP